MARKAATRPAGRNARRENAITLLTADHKKVDKLFSQYEKAKDGESARKQELVSLACAELTIHAQLEEELFYSALRDAIDEGDLIDEAEVEHGSIKDLIATLQASSPADRLYDANVKVLSEYVKHHVKEEQDEIFPKARKAKGLDLIAMGEEMKRRKVQLREEIGLGPEEAVDPDPDATRHSTTSRHI